MGPQAPEKRIPRRGALGLGALALGAVLLTGTLRSCRVRLEDDAPHVPLVPTREPTPDEGLLVQAWADAVRLGRMASAAGASGAAAARLHTAQAATLDQVLRDRRVPREIRSRGTAAASTVPSAAPATGGAATSAPGTAAPGLAAAEAAAWAAAAVDALAHAQAPQLPLLASVAVCRARLADLGGARVPWPAWDDAPSPVDATLVAALREARFYLEVAAARTPGASRAPVQRELARVTALVVLLQSRAGGAGPASAGDGGPGRAVRVDPTPTSSADAGTTPAPEARAAWPLPFPVSDATAARRLVAHALRTLELRLGAAWPAAAGSREAVVSVSRLVHATVAAGEAWGVPLRAFPGLAP
ncbi:hypothetical protein [Arsenicicoccus dermatophilus]|uniref:hypothetical protein n=1 Tax=Arsenicicoccus dermatophilus TaxID=1076331 RepID=UPI003917278A